MATAISSPARSTTVREIFVSAIGRLMLGWLIAAAPLTLVTATVWPEHLGWSVIVGLASLVVAVTALLPGISITSIGSKQSPAEGFLMAILLAMSIRCLGTVALFLMCRYQMGVPAQMVALYVCGWYAVLTSIEVSLLARNAKAL